MLVIEGPWDLTPNAERRMQKWIPGSIFSVLRSAFDVSIATQSLAAADGIVRST